MVGRDTLLIAGSLAYRYKTRRPEDAFFDLDSLDYKVTPSTLSKVRNISAAAAAAAAQTALRQPVPSAVAVANSCSNAGGCGGVGKDRKSCRKKHQVLLLSPHYPVCSK